MRSLKKVICNLILGMSFLFLLLSSPGVFAKAGCCSHHGGVVGCDPSGTWQKCKDGSNSKSCPCSGSTTAPSTHTTKKAPAAAPAPAPVPVTSTSTGTTKSAKGCCSRHGGVKSCVDGHYVCQDGSKSGCSC